MSDSQLKLNGVANVWNEQIVGATNELANAKCFSSSSCCSYSTNAAWKELAKCQRNRSVASEAATDHILRPLRYWTKMGRLGCMHSV
jgi:hypothetical protein